MKMIRLALLCGLVALGQSSVVVTDELEDAIVDEVIDAVIENFNGSEPVPIPYWHETFKTKVAFVTVHGEVTGNNGYFKDMSSVARTEPTEFTIDGNVMSGSVILSFKQLEIGFHDFHAKAAFLALHGDLRMHVMKNQMSVKLAVTLLKEGGCVTTLEDLKVTQLEDFRFHLSPSGQRFNWLFSFVAKLVANSQSKHFAGVVTEKLSAAIKKALLEKEICQKFPFIHERS